MSIDERSVILQYQKERVKVTLSEPCSILKTPITHVIVLKTIVHIVFVQG